MKLLFKTTYYYLLASFFVVALSGLGQYYFVQEKLYNRINKTLLKEKDLLERQLRDQKTINTSTLYKTEYFKLDSIANLSLKEPVFYNESLYDFLDEEEMEHRVLRCHLRIKGQNYQLRIYKPLDTAQTFISSIVIGNIALFLALLFLMILVNTWFSERLWAPFYSTITTLNYYDVDRPVPLRLSRSRVHEFNGLNIALEEMSKKISKYYSSQKEFIENASHELQNPLAIIQNKAELLLQSKNLSEEEMEGISSILNTVERISRLNKSLILLSKIEHHNFEVTGKISINAIVTDTLTIFEEQIDLKQLKLSLNLDEPLELAINRELAELLVVNLIKNAVRHNIMDGIIEITTTNNSLLISNTGQPLEFKNTEILFKRFQKSGNANESLGLGLSIIKEIADVYHIEYAYNVSGFRHNFKLNFH